MFISNRIVCMLYNSLVVNNVLSNCFKLVTTLLVILFLFFRVPYLYGIYFFISLLVFLIIPLFMSLFFNRLESGFNDFFSSFIPVGSPIWIAPLVSLAEGISYIIRPMVLIARPFLNITIGIFGANVLGMSVISNPIFIIILTALFFYEVFVALIHWFIVFSILNFSVDH